MGKGNRMAAVLAPEHAALIDDLKDQLLIVFLKRLRTYEDALVFPIAEVDDTGDDLLAFAVHDGALYFELQKKG